MLGSFRAGQHRRLWTALGRPDLAALSSVEDQEDHRERMAEALRDAMAERTAQEWEEFLVEINVPGARMRDLLETLELEHVRQRGFLHRYETVPDVERPITVPIAAFRYATGGPRVDTPPPRLGADTDAVLRDLGLADAEIRTLHRDGVV